MTFRVATCALIFSGAAVAQIRTETRVVLVDTIVTDKRGDYVKGLTAKDFRVWEDNKEQAVKSVAFERATIGSRPHYLVLFFAPMQAAERIAARQAVSGFIDANVEENRRLAVVGFNGEMRIGQNFTGDAGRLKAAVNAAMSSEVTTGITDSSALDTIRALGNLARGLDVVQGRKTIVLVSGGLSQSSVQKAELAAAIDACNKSDVAVYPIDLRPLNSGLTTTRSGTMIDGPATATTMERRAAAGPQGDRADSETTVRDAGTADQQVLFRLAGGTGGFVIANLGELQGGLQKIGAEQSEYYVLSYTPDMQGEHEGRPLPLPPRESGSQRDHRACPRQLLRIEAGGSSRRYADWAGSGAPRGQRTNRHYRRIRCSFRISIFLPAWRASMWQWRSRRASRWLRTPS